MMHILERALVVLGSAWLLVVGCGGDDGASTSSTGAATSSSADDGGPGGPQTSPATTTTGADGNVDSNVDGNEGPCTGQLEIDGSTLPAATLGQSYDESLGYTAPDGWELAWINDDLPIGLEIEVDATTIRFFGTPTEEGRFQIVFSLFNGDGAACGDSRNVFLSVMAGPGGSGSTSAGDAGSTGGTTTSG